MTVGTKSLLIGAHQFILHPIAVCRAWAALYGSRTLDFRTIVCIILHDIGYWGKPNMDGPEGKLHPALGAEIVGKLFPYPPYRLSFQFQTWKEFTAGHSKSYAELIGIDVSELYHADKYAFCFHPKWLYLLGIILTGENKEYIEVYYKTIKNRAKATLTNEQILFLTTYERKSFAKATLIWYNILYENIKLRYSKP